MFGPILPALSANHQVIAPDLQGHGRTADIDRPIDIRLMADDIAALIDHLELDKPDIVGYSLGGGMGWYARKLGLQANSVTAVELVTTEGELVRADRDNEPGLFWALRGGVGANFGVVTALEFDLYPLEQVYAGVMFFPWERSSEVLHAWHELTPSLPEEITSVGRIIQFPPFPEIPEPMRGKSFAIVEAAYIGAEADGAELLRPVRELGPAMDTFAMVPPAALSEMHMDPPEPVPYIGDGYLIGDLPAKAIDDLVEAAGPDSGSPLISVELRQTGGALGRTAPHHGAVASLPGEYVYYGVGMAMGGEANAAVEGQLARVEQSIGGYRAGTYLNFAEERTDLRDAFAADHHSRLQAVREKYNPDRLFRPNHEIA
jgi:pimeloyl-ACP methyl ester carboxylesterase